MYSVSKRVAIFIVLILPMSLTIAQDTELKSTEDTKPDEYTFGIQIRPRTEYRDGFKTQGTEDSEPAFLTAQRTRLFFGYSSKLFDSKISIQDVRTWGEEKNKSDAPSFDIHEAWFELFATKGLSVKLGRQELKYDDQRLLSWTDWNHNASSHDIAIFKYKKNTFNAHLGLAYNNEREVLFQSMYSIDYYKTMQFLYLSNQYKNGLKLSLLGIADGNQKENSSTILYVRTTYGLNASFKNPNSNLGFHGGFFKQNGKDKTGKRINAYFYNISLNTNIYKNIVPTVGIDYFSGTDALDTTNTVNNSFSNLYGAGYKFLGNMNYFTSIDKHTKGGGIVDLFGKINYKINSKFNSEVAYHVFSLASNVADPNYENSGMQAIDKSLGSELDFVFNYKISDNVNLKFGYATMFANESMDIIKGGDHKQFAQWAYFMVRITPQITKTIN